MDKFRIVMDGPLGTGRVYRNGEEVKEILAVEFHAQPGEVNTVRLTFIAAEIEIEGEGDVVV